MAKGPDCGLPRFRGAWRLLLPVPGGVLRASSLLSAVRGLVLLAADKDKSQTDGCYSLLAARCVCFV